MAFNKKTWSTGNVITAQDLNRLETGVTDLETNKANAADLTTLVNEVSAARGSYGSLSEKLNNIGSGGGGSAGALVYNTLAELQAAYPGGTTQPVWVVADNAWYYWSGTVTPPADTTAPVLTITPGGTYTGSKTVTMSTNETATIYYTLNGSTPTTASSVYSSPLSLSATITLKAFAKDAAGNTSAIQTVIYTLDTGAADTTAPIVTASPAAGTYTSAQNVTLSASETATIYYTLDGTTPTTASTVYSGPINIATTKTLQFIGKDAAGNTSTPVAATYTINIADTTPPADVTGLSITSKTDTTLTVGWTAVSDAASYDVTIAEILASSINMLSLDGNGAVEIPITPAYLGTYSVFLRVKPTLINGGNILSAGGNCIFLSGTKFAATKNTVGTSILSTTDAVANTWYGLGVVYDSVAKTLKIYINGVLEGTRTSITASATQPGSAQIGAGGTTAGTLGSSRMTGFVKDIAIFNRALTDSEINNLNENIAIDRTNIYAEYKMATNETNLVDTSGNNRNGTALGTGSTVITSA